MIEPTKIFVQTRDSKVKYFYYPHSHMTTNYGISIF